MGCIGEQNELVERRLKAAEEKWMETGGRRWGKTGRLLTEIHQETSGLRQEAGTVRQTGTGEDWEAC